VALLRNFFMMTHDPESVALALVVPRARLPRAIMTLLRTRP